MRRTQRLANRMSAPDVIRTNTADLDRQLPAVEGELTYLAPGDGPVEVRVYPPASGRATVRPASVRHTMPIHDARPIARSLRLDEHGFELHSRGSAFADFYDEAAVRERYYPEVQDVMQSIMGALAVVVVDHNVRSAAPAARPACGCRWTRCTTTTPCSPARSASARSSRRPGVPTWRTGASPSSTSGARSPARCWTTPSRCATRAASRPRTWCRPTSTTSARTTSRCRATAVRSTRCATTPGTGGSTPRRCGPTSSCC